MKESNCFIDVSNFSEDLKYVIWRKLSSKRVYWPYKEFQNAECWSLSNGTIYEHSTRDFYIKNGYKEVFAGDFGINPKDLLENGDILVETNGYVSMFLNGYIFHKMDNVGGTHITCIGEIKLIKRFPPNICFQYRLLNYKLGKTIYEKKPETSEIFCVENRIYCENQKLKEYLQSCVDEFYNGKD